MRSLDFSRAFCPFAHFHLETDGKKKRLSTNLDSELRFQNMLVKCGNWTSFDYSLVNPLGFRGNITKE